MVEYELVGIVGVSGSGKTTLADNLEKIFPRDYLNLKQVTTRILRPGDLYTRVTEEKYEEMEDDLIGKTTVNGTKYGTILPNETNCKRFIVVLNKLGLTNLQNDIKLLEEKNPKVKFNLCIVAINTDDTVVLEKRENRDENFILNELNEVNSIAADIKLVRSALSTPEKFTRLAYLEIRIHFDRLYSEHCSDFLNDR